MHYVIDHIHKWRKIENKLEENLNSWLKRKPKQVHRSIFYLS